MMAQAKLAVLNITLHKVLPHVGPGCWHVIKAVPAGWHSEEDILPFTRGRVYRLYATSPHASIRSVRGLRATAVGHGCSSGRADRSSSGCADSLRLCSSISEEDFTSTVPFALVLRSTQTKASRVQASWELLSAMPRTNCVKHLTAQDTAGRIFQPFVLV